ncbi:MAG: FAD-dependent oxidoreductase, partial [Planctomycetes bacterium]|nr:FAD-dependent oxidoreductase [Planctomycetota bacterium]
MFNEKQEFLVEPEKKVPLYRKVDVVVAGSGICGSFAAIAAGRNGAKTVLIDRFGAMGGNIGPAMIVAGTLLGGPPVYRGEDSVLGGFTGISGEFKKRVEDLVDPYRTPHPSLSFGSSYVLSEMAREAGVEFITSSYAADPIIEGNTVKGLFVETCSGRIAVPSRVVIDSTGEASIAARAKAPMIRHTAYDPSWGRMVCPPMNNPECAFWNDTHLLVVMAGVDYKKFEEYRKKDIELSPEDEKWDAHWGFSKGLPKALVPAARRAFEKDGFRIHGDIEKKVPTYISGFGNGGKGVVSFRVAARGEIDCDDVGQMSRIENFVRKQGYYY